MNTPLRIGTRDSELALWQAKVVQHQLENLGHSTTLVPIKSQGDLSLDKPLYELGVTGIFTKALDIALLNKEIDIAVHSMKDVPTILPEGVVQAAVLKRATSMDVLVAKNYFDTSTSCTIATGSLRRKAQWLYYYPHHTVVNLRGTMNTRLEKLEANDWDGAIFAQAGLERIEILPESHILLDWMVPAPAQGALMVVALESDTETLKACAPLNDHPSALCTQLERDFLRALEGGCTAPIGAHAQLFADTLIFKGSVHSPDGQTAQYLDKTTTVAAIKDSGRQFADTILKNGGDAIMDAIKNQQSS